MVVAGFISYNNRWVIANYFQVLQILFHKIIIPQKVVKCCLPITDLLHIQCKLPCTFTNNKDQQDWRIYHIMHVSRIYGVQ